jgi:arylsulfatase A-like enzyme
MANPTSPNILFILTDQERYFADYPKVLEIPGRHRLHEMGVSFNKHYIGSTVCTPSRSVIYTGQHMPVTGMFDNTNFPFVPSMTTNLPTLGTMLRQLGYYTAYKGKWHLASELEPDPKRDHNYANDMERYGFSDWNTEGDVIGHTLDGFLSDNDTFAGAVHWIRSKGLQLKGEGTPWFLSIDLVNPHDIMYFNTDLPGETIHDTGNLMMQLSRAPDTPTYKQTYDGIVPDNWTQELDEEGRPAAHRELMEVAAYALGRIPPEKARWQRFNDYYVNCMKEVDRKIARLIEEVEDLGLLEDTVVVFTADHGELGGAHGLRSKAGNAYEECIHVPLVIYTPGGPAGTSCDAVTSHVDLAPTLLGLSGANSGAVDAMARSLPGKDLSRLIADPKNASSDAARAGALFAYSGVLFLDSSFIANMVEMTSQGKTPEEIRASGHKPDLTKRGLMRTYYDGRYKFSRYFAPTQHNEPAHTDDLREYNEVELFDLEEDPHEMANLAARGSDHETLVAEMNAKLNAAIREEIGTDDGRYLPQVPGMSWAVPEIKNL